MRRTEDDSPRRASEQTAVVTINEVAAAAGVSIRTASRVLNESPKVNAETRARVREVIRELNFVPNLRARALASNKSLMLGFVHDDPNAEIADQMQRGIFGECIKHGYELLVHPCDHRSPDVTENVMSFVRRSRVDGVIIIAPVSENEKLARALRDHGTPVVGVAAVPLEHFGMMIVSRERDASALIAEHLVKLGHRKLGFISGPRVLCAARERQEGFVSSLDRHGIHIRPDHICEGDWSFESGVACAKKVLRSRDRPTAIYASNDRMAAGVLKAAAEAGIQVPADLSVVGFDDSFFSRVLTPALTTINRPIAKIGERAAEWLLTGKNASVSGTGESLSRFFDLKLTVRESTGPLKQGRK